MKNRLLTMAACAMVATVGSPSFAGNWEKPQPKGEAPASKSQYYIYNVAAEKFVVNGANWGTRVTLGDKGLLAELTDSVHTPLPDAAFNTAALRGWVVKFVDKFDGQYDKNLQNVDMFLDPGTTTQVYTNMTNNQGHNFWKFVPWGGNYRLKMPDEDTTFGAETEYADSYVSYFTSHADETITDPIVRFDKLDGVDDAATQWMFISKDNYDVFVAKKALYNKLNLAEEEGAETSDAETVYNNQASTAADYEAACVALQRKIFEKYAAEATFDNPIDLTEQAVQTPQPGNDGKTGWVQTNHGGYAKSGKHSNWSNLEDGIEVFGPNFLEYWVVKPNTLSNDTLYQVVESLPYGVYRLTADAVAIQQAEIGKEVVGVSLFADGGAMTKKALMSEADHLPHRYSVEFAVMQDQTTIGMMVENTNANHAAITNFKLEALSLSSNPLVALLFSEVNKADNVDPYDTPFSQATEDVLRRVAQEAKDLIDGGTATDDELKAKTEELTAVLATVQKEVEKYAWLDNYINKVLPTLELKYAEDFPNLSSELNGYGYELQDKFYARTLTIADIDGVEAKVAEMIREGIRAEIGVGKEITGLLINPDFDNGRDGWTLNSGSIKNVSFKACEAYGEKFDLSQTLTDMPNGRYKVTCQAFYRPRPSGDAWVDYQAQNEAADVRLFLYGNSMQKAVKHVFDDQSAEKLEDGDVQPAGEGGMYSPNNITGISNYFAAGHYQNELEFAVVDGTLTIGLRVLDPIVDAGNNWSAFDNFHIYYLGEQASDYYATIEALREEALALQDNGNVEEGTVLTAEATNKITNAVLLGSTALNGGTVEQCIEAINALSDAVAYGKKSQELTKELLSTYMVYYTRCEGVENPASTDYIDLLDGIDEIFQKDGIFESNEQVQEYLDRLAPEFTAYAISGGIGNATQDKPHDITAVILNPTFDWNNSDSSHGWTGSPGVQANVAEYYNANSFDCNQKIVGMVPGYYRLSVDAFYRAGSVENSTKLFYKDALEDATGVEGDVANFPYIYAANGKKALKNLCSYHSATKLYDDDLYIDNWVPGMDPITKGEDGALTPTPQAYVPNTRSGCNVYFALENAPYRNSLNFQVTEEMDTVTIGIKKENVRINTEWCPFDNFKLEYIGENAPTAINDVMSGNNAAAEVVEQKFYTIDGVQLARPAKGINIVKSVLSDGSVKVAKVLVK